MYGGVRRTYEGVERSTLWNILIASQPTKAISRREVCFLHFHIFFLHLHKEREKIEIPLDKSVKW